MVKIQVLAADQRNIEEQSRQLQQRRERLVSSSQVSSSKPAARSPLVATWSRQVCSSTFLGSRARHRR